jgi:hypothetical protein
MHDNDNSLFTWQGRHSNNTMRDQKEYHHEKPQQSKDYHVRSCSCSRTKNQKCKDFKQKALKEKEEATSS